MIADVDLGLRISESIQNLNILIALNYFNVIIG